MRCDGETVMAAGTQPNPWGEAQRRTRARSFFVAERPRGAGLPAGKKGSVRGFRMGDGCHRSSATSRESSLSGEGARPCRGAPVAAQSGASTAIRCMRDLEFSAMQSRLSRRQSSSVSHPRRGLRVEFNAINRQRRRRSSSRTARRKTHRRTQFIPNSALRAGFKLGTNP